MVVDPDSLLRVLKENRSGSLPPVHLWNPGCVQDIDLRIGRDGTWFYQESPIRRLEMVKLFSTILRRDEEGFYLVTPSEKVSAKVDLAPFIAVKMEHIVESTGPALAFQTNVGDVVVVDCHHPLWVNQGERGPLPFVRVRDRLDALLGRSVFYELAESGTSRTLEGREMVGVNSRGKFWILGATEDE